MPWLLFDGYEVRARLEDLFEAPDCIYGYRPDIFATKNGLCVIVEVKKGEVDWPKLEALQRFERENLDCQLRIVPL